ncbi:MAG: hypothetical protein R2911_27815 [Caldilineaceae bacterium]
MTALMALLIWLPRGLALDRFVTADEHAWLAWSGNFYRAWCWAIMPPPFSAIIRA